MSNRKKELVRLIQDHKLKKYSGYEYNGEEDIMIPVMLEEELDYIERTDTYDDILFLYDIAEYLKKEGIPYWLSSSTGSSLVLYLLGISHTNTLHPHYYYPETKNVEWIPYVHDGYDLPDKEDAVGDGHCITQPVLLYGNQLFCQGMKDLYIEEGYKTHFNINVPESCFIQMEELFKDHWYMKAYGCLPEKQYTFIPGTMGKEKEFTFLRLGNIHVIRDSRTVNNLPERVGENKDICMDDYSEYLAWWSSEGMNIINDTDRFMMKEMGYRLSDLILYEDDIYLYLATNSVSEEDSYIFTRLINEGKISQMPVTREMLIADNKWKLDRINRMHTDEPHPMYRFCKSHFVEQLEYLKSLPKKEGD